VLVAIAAAGASAGAAAQNHTTINGGSVTGVTGVNAASGNNNQQANAGVISAGGTAVSQGGVTQSSANSSGSSGTDQASIADGAFANSSGMIAVNGVSGNDNQQANIAAIAFGTQAAAAADAQLTQTRASTEPTGGTAAPAAPAGRSAEIGDGAFANSQGLVQVSLIGGDRNSSANTFALSVAGPANP
jgi:hypothetical protein